MIRRYVILNFKGSAASHILIWYSCVRASLVWLYNYNQKDANIFSLFISEMLYMFRAVPPPIIRNTQLCIQLQVLSTNTATGWYRGWDLVTGRQQYRCIVPKAVYTVKNCSWRRASLSPETCRADLKRSLNGICCILLVAYIVKKNS